MSYHPPARSSDATDPDSDRLRILLEKLNSLKSHLRNFTVLDQDGQPIGEVDDLILDELHQLNLVVAQLGGASFLLDGRRIKRVSVQSQSVFVDLFREEVEQLPIYRQAPDNTPPMAMVEPELSDRVVVPPPPPMPEVIPEPYQSYDQFAPLPTAPDPSPELLQAVAELQQSEPAGNFVSDLEPIDLDMGIPNSATEPLDNLSDTELFPEASSQFDFQDPPIVGDALPDQFDAEFGQLDLSDASLSAEDSDRFDFQDPPAISNDSSSQFDSGFDQFDLSAASPLMEDADRFDLQDLPAISDDLSSLPDSGFDQFELSEMSLASEALVGEDSLSQFDLEPLEMPSEPASSEFAIADQPTDFNLDLDLESSSTPAEDWAMNLSESPEGAGLDLDVGFAAPQDTNFGLETPSSAIDDFDLSSLGDSSLDALDTSPTFAEVSLPTTEEPFSVAELSLGASENLDLPSWQDLDLEVPPEPPVDTSELADLSDLGQFDAAEMPASAALPPLSTETWVASASSEVLFDSESSFEPPLDESLRTDLDADLGLEAEPDTIVLPELSLTESSSSTFDLNLESDNLLNPPLDLSQDEPVVEELLGDDLLTVEIEETENPFSLDSETDANLIIPDTEASLSSETTEDWSEFDQEFGTVDLPNAGDPPVAFDGGVLDTAESLLDIDLPGIPSPEQFPLVTPSESLLADEEFASIDISNVPTMPASSEEDIDLGAIASLSDMDISFEEIPGTAYAPTLEVSDDMLSGLTPPTDIVLPDADLSEVITPDAPQEQPVIGESVVDGAIAAEVALGSSALTETPVDTVPLMEEGFTVSYQPRKMGEVIVRKQIQTRMVQVPVRYEKLIVEQISPERKSLVELDLSGGELGNVEIAETSFPSITGEFASTKAASSVLEAIAKTLDQRCKKVRVEIEIDDPSLQQAYQEWLTQLSHQPQDPE